ncbi:MAG: SurA N-terminal domain-containing protein [Gammaproteobacteria bacterium]|nr:SurA N-terminal domain-containing protein [Gammaproteobacteria bacterium]MBU2056752.1 SurA N-terminal domain-containing protein [Gammaproteobacteria bacterium]MBU2174089.1 SurA N-terminal domain-containing protein [Gammaproteobacteria bacterium]MBU2247005.1 SurA N-terminal domain-containing protein [Gammaproteobacteria bacterium]MBU2343380.1 SurA N-terminal domain-containing protein [Gammaproteobacteria bacterium]
MLEKIREGSQGMIAKVILGFVILTFALAGVGSYLGNTSEMPVATVNGDEITKVQFDTAYQNERARMQQQFGEMFGMLSADSNYMNNFRNSVLEKLIDEQLQRQLVTELDLMVSDEVLRDTIRSMPEFQVEGVFNNDRYIALLRQNGYEPNQFRDYLRAQMSANQLVVGLAGSEFATVSEMQLLSKLQMQSRDIQYAVLKAADFAAAVEINDQLLQDYYQANANQFVSPETVSVDYVQLTAADIAATVDVTDADLQAYYEANQARYQTEERRRVSHILLESADDNAEIEAKAQALALQLQQGADFAELAKKESADTFSAEKGGDLDFIEKGVMDAEFEKAAYALAKAGDISPVVKTEFGYHIIQLTEVQPGSLKTFDEVKDQILATVKDDKAAEKFIDLQQLLGEKSFEIADSLQEAAEAVGTKVVSVPAFSRSTAPAELTAPKVLATLFSEDFISAGVNSDVIEVAPQHVVVVRVNTHQPETTKKLEEVKEQVQAAVVATKSSELAKAKAEVLLAEVQAGKSLSEVAAAAELTLETKAAVTRFGGDIDSDIRTKAFELAKPTEAQPATVAMLNLAGGDAALVAVTKVTDSQVTEKPAVEQLQQFADQKAQGSFGALLAALKAKAQITRSLPEAAADE